MFSHYLPNDVEDGDAGVEGLMLLDKALDVPGLSLALKNERNGIYITGYHIEERKKKLKIQVESLAYYMRAFASCSSRAASSAATFTGSSGLNLS